MIQDCVKCGEPFLSNPVLIHDAYCPDCRFNDVIDDVDSQEKHSL